MPDDLSTDVVEESAGRVPAIVVKEHMAIGWLVGNVVELLDIDTASDSDGEKLDVAVTRVIGLIDSVACLEVAVSVGDQNGNVADSTTVSA